MFEMFIFHISLYFVQQLKFTKTYSLYVCIILTNCMLILHLLSGKL